jgi:hypothetical protein
MKLNSKSLLIVLIIWIGVVGLLFAVIPDKKTASVIAGSGFVILPLLILFSEMQKSERNLSVIVASSVFFIFSALPIFLLRVLNWEKDFKELSVFGVPSEVLHRASNFLYIVMLIAVGVAFWRERNKSLSQK